MSKAFIDDTNLTDIADAIRSKLGVSDTYLPSEMAGAIQSIPKRKVIDFNITPKTLDNAEQNSLQYVKAYGKCEQNGTPTPEHPVDIVCNNGVLKVSGNLFNKYTCTDGYYYNASLQYTSNDILSLSDYIPVVPENVYVLSGYTNITLNLRVNFFNSSKEIISQDVYNNLTDDYELSVTIPTNIYYMRYSFDMSQKNSQQFELGTSATTYRSYGEIYTEGNTETIKISSENLVDFTSLTIVPNKAITENGELVSNNGVNFCESYIPILPNQTYKISGDILGGDVGQLTYYFRLASYDVDKIFISRRDAVTGTEYTFTTDSTTRYIRFHYINTATLNTYKLQLDNTATCQDLLSLPGYTDTQEILSGVVNRKIGIKVLDGSESWVKSSNGVVFYVDNLISDVDTSADVAIFCTHLKGVKGSVVPAINSNSTRIYVGGLNIRLGCYPTMSDYADAAAWATFLATQYANGTPVIIVYPLATPTTESVTDQSLQVEAGDNTLEITQSSLPNLEVECEYFIQ